MKKLFNNSTKGNDTQNKSSKSKRKFLKTFSFTSLALLMGAAGVFAFAPLGATNPQLANANEMVDQINTKADGENIKYAPSPLGLDPENDPVIYTTESGLEIKFGGTSTAIGGGHDKFSELQSSTLASGALQGYPYITFGKYSNYNVNWIIMARSTTFSSLNTISYQALSHWQTNASRSGTYNNFFTKTYEIVTPAGLAVKNDNLLNDITSRKFVSWPYDLSGVTARDDIAADSVLCFSECVLGTSKWSSSDSGGCNSLNSSVSNRYSNLGLTSAELGVMTTRTSVSYSGVYGITTYLTTNALRVAYTIGTTTAQSYWTNSGYSTYTAYAFTNGGAVVNNSEGYCGRDDSTHGVRLAAVFNLSPV